jgi:hypothetical protein
MDKLKIKQAEKWLDGNSVADVVRHMVKTIKDAQELPTVHQIAQVLRDCEPHQVAETLGNFFFKTCYFEPDPPQLQRIKSPDRMLRDGKGNCVNYSIAISAILKALGYVSILRVVKLPGTDNFGHVYPVLIVDGKEIPIDIVPTQEQTGSEGVVRSYNTNYTLTPELPYLSNFDTLIQ